MESRLRLFLLMPLLALGTVLSTSGCALFNRNKAPDTASSNTAVVPPTDNSATAPTTTSVTEPVIDPNIERRKVKVPKIKSSNFELTAYGGILSIEDFGSNSVYGGRLAYHVTESFFLEGSYGRSRGGKTSAETLGGNLKLVSDNAREYQYYALSAGWDALPGEIFVGENRAYNSALYLIIGAGATKFADDNRFTVNGGFGYRVLLNNWLSTHLDVRDYLFDSDLTGPKKVTNNLEATLGLSFFF